MSAVSFWPIQATRSPRSTPVAISAWPAASTRRQSAAYVQASPGIATAMRALASRAWRSSAAGKLSNAVTPRSIVRFARLVERLAPETVEAELGRPRQHQRAAAAVAIEPLERQRLQHR